MPPMMGMGLADTMAEAPSGADGQASFITGLLAGAGLREISQVLGLSRRREGAKASAMPSSATALAGNLGDLDKLMLLAKAQQAMGGMGGAPPLGGPGLPPPGMPPMPPGAMPPPGLPPGRAPGLPPMGAGPMGPPPGMPMLPPAMMGGPGMPMLPPGMGPGPGGPLGVPSTPTPGGSLPMMLLERLLAGAGGVM